MRPSRPPSIHRVPFPLPFFTLFITALTPFLLADHGPGTTGGGVATQSGDTLPKGRTTFGLTWDFTQFESLTTADIARKAAHVDESEDAHFDALRWSLLGTLEVVHGITDDLQVGASIGLYRGDDLREAHVEDTGDIEQHDHGDVQGLTDPWFTVKYRALKGALGHLALLGGVKLPLGRDDVEGDDGEPLEPSQQPGSGAFDFLAGAAYSVWLTGQLTLDASAAWTFRTENDDFRIGDKLDAGASLGWRIIEDAKAFPQVTLIGGINLRHLLRNVEAGRHVSNTGGTVLFLSPGISVAFTEGFSLFVAPQIPVLQDLNDVQQETLFKVAAGVTFTF